VNWMDGLDCRINKLVGLRDLPGFGWFGLGELAEGIAKNWIELGGLDGWNGLHGLNGLGWIGLGGLHE